MSEQAVIPDAIVRLVGELQIRLTMAQEQIAELERGAGGAPPDEDDPAV